MGVILMTFYRDKIENAISVMKEQGIDTWIIAGTESATNTEPVLTIISDHEFIGYTALIFNSDGTSKCVCTPIDKNGYEHAAIFDDVEGFPVSFADSVGNYLGQKKPKTIALNFSETNPASDGLSTGCFMQLQDAFDLSGEKFEIVSAEKIVRKIKGVKSEREIECIREACKITEEIFESAKDFIKPGVNCQEIFAFFQNEVAKRNLTYSWPKSCNPGVFSGADCPRGHMGAPDFVVQKGHLVNVDFGIIVNGYSSDMQRMYYILKDDEEAPCEDAVKGFETVRDAIALAAKALVPGVTGFEVDKVARDYVMSKGYPSWGSALGHSIGAFAHDGGQTLAPEKPGVDRSEEIHTPIEEGSVFTLEPSVPTSCGVVGIEEDVVCRKDGAEFLVPPQTELYVIRGR